MTPYVAQKWLRNGLRGGERGPVFYPVIIRGGDTVLTGREVLKSAVTTSERVEAVVVDLGADQGLVAWETAVSMRANFSLEASDDVPGVVLSESGRVLGGASALYDLRREAVMVVLVVGVGEEKEEGER